MPFLLAFPHHRRPSSIPSRSNPVRQARVTRSRSLIVPHLAVRHIKNVAQLGRALADLQEARIDKALVVAGDLAQPVGRYHNSMQILVTGLRPQHGINTIGIAGHPEGSPAVIPTLLRRALQNKAQLAGSIPCFQDNSRSLPIA